jgi:hypothetical protein
MFQPIMVIFKPTNIIKYRNTLKPRFSFPLEGLKKKQWIRENNRRRSLYKNNKNDQICLYVFTKYKMYTNNVIVSIINPVCITSF